MDKTICISLFTVGIIFGAAAQDLYQEHKREQWLASKWGEFYSARNAQLDLELDTCEKTTRADTWPQRVCKATAFQSWGKDISQHGDNLKQISHKVK